MNGIEKVFKVMGFKDVNRVLVDRYRDQHGNDVFVHS